MEYNTGMASESFFFYDLETTGTDPRRDRIMQFAGQRTDAKLKPIGEPINWLVCLTDEVLPAPEAILITGLTPQQTVREGMSEAELAHRLTNDVFTPGTTVVGFNNVRFDDVFIRYLFYRNFHDPYEWAWADGRSRWDLLDVVRMARALRPDGLQWPTDGDGQPTNKLELVAAANGLTHTKAHDALSDVEALISLAQLLRQHQPKFFDYLFEHRTKREVLELVNPDTPQPFIYTSGRYLKSWQHTTIAWPVGASRRGAIYVYDLRYDPATYAEVPFDQLASSRWAKAEERAQPDFKPFPAKELNPGNCPAVAPLGTLTPAAEERIGLTRIAAEQHLATLRQSDLPAKLREIMNQSRDFEPSTDVDARLYDGFLSPADKNECSRVRTADAAALAALRPHFTDPRLPELFTRYKARNYPDTLSDEERTQWETYRAERLQADWPMFAASMERAGQKATETELSLLTDLTLWAQSILPAE